MAEIAAMETFFDPHVFGMAVAARVEPALAGETHRVDDQRVAFPSPDGIAQPRSPRIDGKLPSVHVDLAIYGLHFIQEQHFAWRLDDLKRLRQKIGVRHAIRQASEIWTDN